MKLQEIIKKNIKYVILFVLFFLGLQFFYMNFAGDQIYNYGFSYAVSRGEIPYRDFNMIIPPLGAFIYAIPFVFFGQSLVVFNLFQAGMLCVMFHFLFKLFGKNAWIALIVLFLPIPVPCVTVFFQGYNFLLILELIIILYLEKYKKSDYLVGVLLGLAILSKQTVGFLMCLPSLVYLFKDYRKVLKRIAGFLIPCGIFLIYLLVTGSFVSFFDMCLFGMFDFVNENGGLKRYLLDFYFYLFIIEIIALIFYIWKVRKNKDELFKAIYILLFASISVPLFDYNHVSYFSFVFSLLFIDKIKIKYNNFGFNACLFSSAVAVIWFLFIWDFGMPNMVNFNNYELALMPKKNALEFEEVTDFMEKHENSIILSENSYLVKIILDDDITHYDLLNYGNHGYKGTDKLIKRFKKEKDMYIVINTESYERNSVRMQFNKEFVTYVMDNCKKIDSIGVHDIYYKE